MCVSECVFVCVCVCVCVCAHSAGEEERAWAHGGSAWAHGRDVRGRARARVYTHAHGERAQLYRGRSCRERTAGRQDVRACVQDFRNCAHRMSKVCEGICGCQDVRALTCSLTHIVTCAHSQ